jgi:hypothetical protein
MIPVTIAEEKTLCLGKVKAIDLPLTIALNNSS